MRMLLVVLLLAACAPAVPSEPRPDPIAFTFDAAGVQLSDRAQRIDFGRTDHSTIPAMSKLVGAQPTATQACANGGQQVEWANGTRLIFSRGEFRGWATSTARAGIDC